jgi:hypothetical protein
MVSIQTAANEVEIHVFPFLLRTEDDRTHGEEEMSRRFASLCPIVGDC